LARRDAADLAILGAGTQARGHLEAMLAVRPIRRVRVWSLPVEQAHEFARSQSQKFGLPVEVAESARAAVEDAEIICTVTSAREPVLQGDWVSPGAHINAVGSSVPHTRELDTNAVVKSRLFVDRRESTLNEAGDFLFPKKEGAIDDDHIQGEIGEILTGRIKGRVSDGEITLFKSLGLAIEDLAAAHHVYHMAKEKGMGTWVEIGGEHFSQQSG
jgi:ornithine cyclodeaminase/alanine dehydrogenase-like protein (mu-crystallin family)